MSARRAGGRAAPPRRVDARIPYTPHEKQAAFHNDRYKVRYRAALAGTGGGKTFAAAFESLSWMLENPYSLGIIGEPDYKMLKRIVLPALCDVLGVRELTQSPLVRRYHETDHRLELVNGSACWLMGLEDPEKVEGPSIDWAWIDEIRMIRKWGAAWKAIRRRLRGSRPGTRIGAWVTTHSPTKEQSEFFEGEGKDRHPSAKVYRWSSLDNLMAPQEYLDDILRAHPDGVARRAVIEGFHARPEGLVYQGWDHAQHVRRWTGGRSYDDVSYGVDWGHSVPASLGSWIWTGARTWGVEEYYGAGYSIDDLIDAAKDMEDRWGEGVWWCDKSRPEHIEAFCDAGLDARATETKRVEDGTGILQRMIRGGELLVDPRREKFLYEIDRYGLKPGTDEPEKGNDHAMDEARYAIVNHLRAPKAQAW